MNHQATDDVATPLIDAVSAASAWSSWASRSSPACRARPTTRASG